ncbi:hypothetical protein I3842_05G198000 [Carya illinoinensis]|uniref:DUF7725 domain-containing protein n=1 Tax=Carya illinoinensis TaxID=32201 RepID=A0A922JMX8_CARIL|nr:hypothetical protein I3842_05G198000 [Carya illinoinensis]KAG6714321.1 hypothetical protein I3842_05G198000 [Carya illinoinensis]
MEPSAGVAASTATRGGSLSMQPPSSSTSSSRKEWRAVSEHRKAGDERLHNVARQREELQQTEIGFRAQIIARSEIMGMQSNFDAQIKEHANAAMKLQEQLHEREQAMHELERKMEEKDRELHAIKLDNEVAWAKEDLLREKDKELSSLRRERDHFEAERAQHIKQIHDLQEHIQEKDRQLIELQDQHRVAQENIIYKDEQLREAQAWIARVQEMDVLQSNTNHSLQAELRERTEQYNQLWLGCQRQFAEMERHHLHTMQQLQLELADARERSGTYNDEPGLSQTKSKDVSQFDQSNGIQLDANGGGTLSGNSAVLPNGNSGNVSSFASTGNSSAQTDRVPGVPLAPSSLLGMPTYLPPGQVAALHPYAVHQHGPPQSLTSHIPPSHIGHFHSIPAMGSLQQWVEGQNPQAVSEGLQISAHSELPPSQTDQNLMRSDANYNYEMSVNGQPLHQDYLEVHISQVARPDSGISSSSGEAKTLESIDGGFLIATQPEQSLQQISSQFHDVLKLDNLDRNSENKEQNATGLTNGLEGQLSTAEEPSSVANPLASDASIHSVNLSETAVNNVASAALPESIVSIDQANTPTGGKASEPTLLDERSLLACVVRTIPAGGRIRISSTLPNRLGKMLAPLHWHDYKKKYGKLDDFVISHPELFVIEGDYIQLREGAQEMIAAEAAVAKVAAAAAASSPYSSFLPSMAVTPVAQSHRLRKVPSIESKNLRTDRTAFKEYAIVSSNSSDEPSQLSVMQNQQPNGVGFGLSRGPSNIKILSKPKDPQEMNGPENKAVQSPFVTVGNGSNLNRTSLNGTQSTGPANGRANVNFVGKQQGRMTGAVFSSRR